MVDDWSDPGDGYHLRRTVTRLLETWEQAVGERKYLVRLLTISSASSSVMMTSIMQRNFANKSSFSEIELSKERL